MLVEQRRARLLELIRERGFASLPELAEQLGVSESTVRRDLDFLGEAGTAKRTHGGAFFTGGSSLLPPFEERQPAHWDAKRAIARRVADLVEDGDALLLDGGSTTYEVARLLVGRPLQIVTNSLPVANLFAASASTDLVLVGGYVYPRTGVSLGPHADAMLANISVRRTVLSVGGITERGYFNSNLLLVETERAMMRAADEVIVVADASKFGHRSLAHLAELGAANRLVVEETLSPQWRHRLKQAGVAVELASLAQGDSTDTAKPTPAAPIVPAEDRSTLTDRAEEASR